MTGSLRLSALLLLLLSRWASADLETGEDEFVRSWVIIEEQLVPPSRDDQLLAAGGGGVAIGGASAGRRITPKSVFVAPSFSKCSDGYRPDTMGRCVKVVKLNQAAQWDFLLKQLNSMYGPGAPKPVGASAYHQAAPAIMITTESSSQKTESPGPFQLNIPFAGNTQDSSEPSAESASDEQLAATSTTTAVPSTTIVTGTGTITDDAVTVNPVAAAVGTTVDIVAGDDADAMTTGAAETTITGNRPRPHRNRHQTTTQRTDNDEDTTINTTPFDSQVYPTTTAMDTKSKYVDGSRTTAIGTTDGPSKTIRPANQEVPSLSFPSAVVTTTAVDDTETEEPVTGVAMAATTTESEDEEDVVTVLAVAASADGSSGRPSSSTTAPYTTTRVPYTTADSVKTHSQAPEAVSPEYYDDQPDDPTAAPEPDCSAPNAYRYHPACANFRQQQIQQIQQQQLLLQQLQQHQHQQFYQQQQQQQFYHQQQLLQQQHQQQPQTNHVAAALVKRPATGGGVQVRFPGDEDPASGDANLVRFPGSAPYRTTNKMYESSRHPTWWPTAWPEQQQQQQQQPQSQQQPESQQQPQSQLQPQPEDPVYQQHRLQHHLPQKKQDVRLWEFGSRLPKTTSTTTVLPPPPPPPPTQWFHQFF